MGHPSIRINFDTANIYFYNREADAVAELRKVLPYVASLHLKDTTGEYRGGRLPALGQGIVDFPAIFRILDEQGFAGPLTTEIEGLQGPDREAAFAAVLRDSLAYLSELGRV